MHARQPTPLLEVFHHIVRHCSHWPCNQLLENKVHNCHKFMEHNGMINLPIAKNSLHNKKLLTLAKFIDHTWHPYFNWNIFSILGVMLQQHRSQLVNNAKKTRFCHYKNFNPFVILIFS